MDIERGTGLVRAPWRKDVTRVYSDVGKPYKKGSEIKAATTLADGIFLFPY